MNHLLIVSEKCSIIYAKLLLPLAEACRELDVRFSILTGEQPSHLVGKSLSLVSDRQFSFNAAQWNEHGYLDINRVARELGADQVFLTDMPYPQRLYSAMETEPDMDARKWTFKITGASFYRRYAINGLYTERLLSRKCINRVLSVTNNPAALAVYCKKNNIMDSDKVAFSHDPVYDPDFATIEKKEARKKLNLPEDGILFLFFGSFFYSKAPDILAQAAGLLRQEPDFHFVFAGSTASLPDFVDRTLFASDNITMVDRFIEEQEEILFYSACDYVVMPYRRFYEFGSSAVLVQASLARRPLIMADIFPFADSVREYNLGRVFDAESAVSLAETIRHCRQENGGDEQWGFQAYLDTIEPWPDILKLIV